MAYQLIYTSYQSSLVQGRTGFSTVARSVSMPERLVAEIERISQYDIEKGTVFAHRIISLSAQVYHVLTRTKDCGVDYTNRNNYIAHHLIFSAQEVDNITANPAEVMLCFDGWVDAFEGEPRFIEDIDCSQFCKSVVQLPARTWQRRFGDCGYASVLGDNSQIYADVNDSTTLLYLYAEALLLLKLKNTDWCKTFTTHSLSIDKPTDFNWCAGNSILPENADIDLSRNKSKVLPSGRGAEYARSGVATNAEKYNLSVQRNESSNKGFNVVESEKSSYVPVYIGIAVSVVILVIAIVYYALGSGSSDDVVKQTEPKKEVLSTLSTEIDVPANIEQPDKKMTLSEIITQVREKINNGKFSEAIECWNKSQYAKKHPRYLEDFQYDIASTIKRMMRFAENVSLNDMASEKEKNKALTNLEIIENSVNFLPETSQKLTLQKIAELRRAISKNK